MIQRLCQSTQSITKRILFSNVFKKQKGTSEVSLEQELKERKQKIYEVNKSFLGVQNNTKYLKAYNEDRFNKIIAFKGASSINLLPFKLNFKSPTYEKTFPNHICQHIFNKMEKQQIENKLKEISFGFFNDLIYNQRKVLIQPNFERQARKNVCSLKNNNYDFKLEQNQNQKIHVKHVSLFKGLRVNRNDNYSTDSYQVLSFMPGFQMYQLFEEQIRPLPQQEWHSLRNILMRIQYVANPCILSIKDPKRQQAYSDKQVDHHFVVEMNLKLPPSFSQFRVGQEEYLKMYKPCIDELKVTNVDQTNPYYALTYEQAVKLRSLINHID